MAVFVCARFLFGSNQSSPHFEAAKKRTRGDELAQTRVDELLRVYRDLFRVHTFAIAIFEKWLSCHRKRKEEEAEGSLGTRCSRAHLLRIVLEPGRAPLE